MFISSTDNIVDTEEYTSGTVLMDRADRVAGMIFSDQAVTLYIEQSADGTNWDVSTDYSISANDGKGFSEEVLAAYVRIRVENDSGSDTTAFRLSAKASSAGDS
jgi:hypothetical protein